MTPDTKGRQRLAAWIELDPEARTRAAIAERLGVSAPSVSGWLHQTSRPTPALRADVEDLTEGFVPADDWKTPEERTRKVRVKPMRKET